MATPTIEGRPPATGTPYPTRLDVTMSILAVCLVVGFFIDLWAHSHGRVDESVLTPWHAILYASAGVFGGVLGAEWLRNRRQGAPVLAALPAGYGLALIGAGLFLAAGLGDLVWHSIFGVEEDIDALLSPTHLGLAGSGLLMTFGPVRSAWAHGPPTSFPRWLPWGAALTMGLAILGAFTQYVHPAIDTWAETTVSLDHGRSDLALVGVDGSGQTRVQIEGADQVWLPDYADDGRLAVSMATGDTGKLVIVAADGSGQTVIHEGAGLFHHAEWSPDQSMIAFTDEVDGAADIFVIPAGGGEATRLTDAPGSDWGPSWNPTGEEIVFTSDRGGRDALYLVPVDGGEATPFLDVDEGMYVASYSPSGEWLVFETGPEGERDIARIRPDGSGFTRLTTGMAHDVAPSWSPDGSSIAFASDRDGNLDMYLMASDGSGQRNLTRHPGVNTGWAGTTWSPDQTRIATNQSGHTPFWAEPFVRQGLGMAGLLVQASLIAGFLLTALRHGPVPFGFLTLMIGASGALMTMIGDLYWYILVALIAGLMADVTIRLARPSPNRPAAIRLVAFAAPAVWVGAYLGALAGWGQGIGWSVHMTFGAPLVAGAAGLLLSFLAFPGTVAGPDPAGA